MVGTTIRPDIFVIAIIYSQIMHLRMFAVLHSVHLNTRYKCVKEDVDKVL